MPKLVEGWKAPDGICPSCLYKVEGTAIRTMGGWGVIARCFCRQQNDVHPWPFEEGILVPDAVDFRRLGLEIEISQDVLDHYEKEEEEYLNQVDYGWEYSWC